MFLVQQLLYFFAGLVQLQVKNHLSRPIWVVIESGDPSQPGQSASFGLKRGEQRSLFQGVEWSGKVWARGWDGIHSLRCENGQCTNPNEYYDPYNPYNPGYPNYPNPSNQRAVTVAEINLRARNDIDQYDISLVNGFNIPIAITPIGGKGDCKTITCDYLLAVHCPPDLNTFTDFPSCDSYCSRHNNEEYCCTGYFDQPSTCNPYNWPSNAISHFKKECPNAYSYKYDPSKGQNTCSRALQYVVTFG